MTVLYRCGYFMVFPKCSLEPTTDPISLGVGCDTAQRRLYVPEDKLLELEAILLEAIDSRGISFSELEKLAGKCTSMSVAVAPPSLYAHGVYRQGMYSSVSEAIESYHRSQHRTAEWLVVRTRLNGAPWHDATRHVLTIPEATDATSQARGGLIRELSAPFPFSEQPPTFR